MVTRSRSCWVRRPPRPKRRLCHRRAVGSPARPRRHPWSQRNLDALWTRTLGRGLRRSPRRARQLARSKCCRATNWGHSASRPSRAVPGATADASTMAAGRQTAHFTGRMRPLVAGSGSGCRAQLWRTAPGQPMRQCSGAAKDFGRQRLHLAYTPDQAAAPAARSTRSLPIFQEARPVRRALTDAELDLLDAPPEAETAGKKAKAKAKGQGQGQGRGQSQGQVQERQRGGGVAPRRRRGPAGRRGR